MAKQPRRLTRELVQDYLSKSDEERKADSNEGRKKKKKKTNVRKRVTMVTRAVGNTLIDGLKAEVDHIDFKTRLKGFFIGLALAAGVLLLSFIPFIQEFKEPFEAQAYDFRMQTRVQDPPESQHIVHLDIDDKSIERVGRWPWKRQKWAGVVEAAKEIGVERLVFDVEFFNRQEQEVNTKGLKDFIQWGNQELSEKVDGTLKEFVLPSLQEFSDWAQRINDQLKKNDPSKLSKLQQEQQKLKLAIDEASRIIRQQNLGEEVSNEFYQKVTKVVIDHDHILAQAIEKAGNVYLPLHFSHNGFVDEKRNLNWNKEIINEIFAYFDQQPNIAEINRKTFEQALLRSKTKITYPDSEDNQKTINKKRAQKTAQEEYQNLQNLYLYHKVRSWYNDKPKKLVREHMKAYLDDKASALLQRKKTGEVLGMFARVDPRNTWYEVAVDQLQMFYSWHQLRYGKGLSGQEEKPWALPTSIIQGYDKEGYDIWATRGKTKTFLPHHRDIEFHPAIFSLFARCSGTGFVSIETDEDGILRRVPLASVYEESFSGERVVILQIAFQTLLEDIDADFESLKIIPERYVEFSANPELVKQLQTQSQAKRSEVQKLSHSVKKKRYRIQIDNGGAMRINWTGDPGHDDYADIFSHVPIAQLVDIAAAQEEIKLNHERWERGEKQYRLFFLEAPYFEPKEENALTERLGSYFQLPLASLGERLIDLRLYQPNQIQDLLSFLEKSLQNYGSPTYDSDQIAQKFRSLALQELELSPTLSDQELAESFQDEQTGYGLTSLWKQVKQTLNRPLGTRFHLRTLKKTFKIMTAEQKQLLVTLILESSVQLLNPDFDFEGNEKKINQLIKEVYGSLPHELGENHDDQKKALEQGLIGRLFTSGKALRSLLFNTEQTLDQRTLEQVTHNSEKRAQVSKEAAESYLDMLRWELDLLVKAGVLISSPEFEKIHNPDKDTETSVFFNFPLPIIALRIRDYRHDFATYLRATEKFTQSRQENIKKIKPLLEGRFALIGAAATALGDVVPTPIHARIPGPALHTNTYNTALFQNQPYELPWFSFLVVSILALAVCLCSTRFSALWSLVGFSSILVGYFIIDSVWIFSYMHGFFYSTVNLSALLVPFLGIQLYRYAVEYREKQKIKGQFGKYLDPEVVDQLQKNPNGLRLGGDEVEATVYFSDIAGFTPISESMSAPRLVDFLNTYMTKMCDDIKENQGTLDKFIGDAIMAFWGAPLPVTDSSARACKTAVRNAQKLKAWNRERKERGELQIGTRIGIATGPMVVGNMGSEDRLNYTCIGDTVNLAARLEAANKQYGTQVMLNETCYQQAKDILVAHKLDNIAVKGKSKGVPVYHLIGLIGEVDPDIVDGCRLYDQAFLLYQAEKWAEALEKFKQAKTLLPPAYDVELAPSDHMIQRCESLIGASPEKRMEVLKLSSPDAEWDGIWKLTSK